MEQVAGSSNSDEDSPRPCRGGSGEGGASFDGLREFAPCAGANSLHPSLHPGRRCAAAERIAPGAAGDRVGGA